VGVQYFPDEFGGELADGGQNEKQKGDGIVEWLKDVPVVRHVGV